MIRPCRASLQSTHQDESGLQRLTQRATLCTSGFTLIELLIVVTIILVLAGLIISLIGPLREMITVSNTATKISTVQKGLTLIGTNEGSATFELQRRSEYQASATPPDTVVPPA